jgi:GT2 family glycosyltransferase
MDFFTKNLFNMNHKLGFVFTNYNNSNDTLNTVRSISDLDIDFKPIIVIVDNNSDLGQIKILNDLKREYLNVHLILNNENVGYFKGLNHGIKYLIENNYMVKYLVVGNNDLFFPKDFYNQIILNEISFLTYPVISPNIITEDGVYQNPHVINEISKFRELIYDVYFLNYTLAKIIKKIALITNYFTDRSDETFHDKSQIIYQGHGSCYILTPKFFEHFQELFAPTFLMGEEFFLSLQLKQKNLNLFYESNVCLTHKWHSSINNVPARKIWEISRESHRIYRKYIKII